MTSVLPWLRCTAIACGTQSFGVPSSSAIRTEVALLYHRLSTIPGRTDLVTGFPSAPGLACRTFMRHQLGVHHHGLSAVPGRTDLVTGLPSAPGLASMWAGWWGPWLAGPWWGLWSEPCRSREEINVSKISVSRKWDCGGDSAERKSRAMQPKV
jgi:hypothetical protein